MAPLSTVGVAEHPLVLVLPLGHPLVRRTRVTLADLADARWIDAPESAIPLARLRTASGTDGFRAALRYEGTHVPGLLAMVSAGHGLAVLPRHAVGAAPSVPIARLVHRVEQPSMRSRSGVR